MLSNIKFILYKTLHSLLGKVILLEHTQQLHNIGCLFKKTDIGKKYLEKWCSHVLHKKRVNCLWWITLWILRRERIYHPGCCPPIGISLISAMTVQNMHFGNRFICSLLLFLQPVPSQTQWFNSCTNFVELLARFKMVYIMEFKGWLARYSWSCNQRTTWKISVDHSKVQA